MVMIAALVAVYSGVSGAAHAEVSLPGSDFEIDTDANLAVDDADPSIDWLEGGSGSPLMAGVVSQQDTASGQTDNAFGQGSKEDTPIPSVVLGGVPPNKSDLKYFGVVTERNAFGNFLHLFWTRVQDPSGTTLMDFEFNREKCDPTDPDASLCSGNGVTPVRTAGDLLISYELAQGGSVAELFLYRWLGSAGDGSCEASNKYPCWGEQVALNGSGDAVGSINQSFIPADLTGGLSENGLDPRTFGEATVNLDAIFNPNLCESFGSAYLKSRSSDSFTAALKDFVAPVPVALSNCGTVITRKVTDPTPDPTSTSFGFTNNLLTDPADPSVQAFSLDDGGSNTAVNVLSGSYAMTEDDPTGLGFTLTDIDCTASDAAVAPTTDTTARTASFTISAGDVIDCTFTNTLQRGTITVIKNTVGGDGTFDFTSSTLGDFQLVTETNTASKMFKDLVPGEYDVAESEPAGWDLTSAACDDGSDPSSIDLAPGGDVTCTFVNTKRGMILVDKVTNPAGSLTSFGFSLTGGPDSLDVPFSLTDEAAPFDSGYIRPGSGYAAAESTPAGWSLDAASCDDGSVPGAIDLAPGETVTCTFENSTGAILISKTTKHATLGPQPLQGVTFDVHDADAVLVASPVTDPSGTVCVAGLKAGQTYTITETAAPAGYDPTAVTPQNVVAPAAECNGAGTPAQVDFVNDPLSKITIEFESLAGPGVTIAPSVVCTADNGFDSGELGVLGDDDNPEAVSITDLREGVYTCVIVVDP